MGQEYRTRPCRDFNGNFKHNYCTCQNGSKFFSTVELGYCLRGENCPYSHGTNVVAINDLDKLQQFNVPMHGQMGAPMQPGGTSQNNKLYVLA